MAQTTKQDTSVAMANQLVGICGQAKQLYDSIVAFNARNTNVSPDTVWRKMATAAQALDGSLGAPDGTPVLTNPITVGGINRAEADLLQGLTFAIEYAQFVAGSLPTNRAAIDRRPALDTLIG